MSALGQFGLLPASLLVQTIGNPGFTWSTLFISTTQVANLVVTGSLTYSGGGGGGGDLVFQNQLTSTTIGLGTLPYVSSGGLTSTVQGLGQLPYVSTAGLTSTTRGLGLLGYVSTLSLTSTTRGLGAIGFVSTQSLVSTTDAIFTAGYLSTPNLTSTVAGLGQIYLSSAGSLQSGLTSTVIGLGTVGYVSTTTLNSSILVLQTSGFLSTPNLTSTVAGLGQTYFSSAGAIQTGLTSTVQGLGTVGYVSTLSLTSTVAGLGQTYFSSAGAIQTGLTSTVQGLGTVGYTSSATVGVNLTSTTRGLGTIGYVSTLSLTSTVASLQSGQVGSTVAISSITAFTSNLNPVNVNTYLLATQPNTSNIWIAGGTDSGNACIKYSLDGITWSNTTGVSKNVCWAMAFNGSYFLLNANDSGGGGNVIYRSTDGVNWTSVTTSGSRPGDGTVGSLMWSGTFWFLTGGVSGGTSNTSICRSTDGVTWTAATSGGFAGNCRGIAYNGSRMIAVGYTTGDSNTIRYSDDHGSNWTNATNGFNNQGSGVTTDGKIWVATGYDVNPLNTIKYSYDGLTWSNITANGFTSYGLRVRTNGRMFVAAGAVSTATLSNYIKYSYDGINWSNAIGLSSNALAIDLQWSGTRWVAATTHATNKLVYSSDGINWSNGTGSLFTTEADSVAFSSNVFPNFQAENLSVFGKSQWPTNVSTNTIHMDLSTMVFDTLRVGWDGRVGVNTTRPSYPLDVNGTTRILGNLQLGQTNVTTTGTAASPSPTLLVQYPGDGNAYVRNMSTTGYLYLGASNTNTVQVTHTQRVGIGRDPSYTLDVNGYTNIGTTNSLDGTPLYIFRNANNVGFGSGISFQLLNASSAQREYCAIYGGITSNTASAEYGFFGVYPRSNGSQPTNPTLYVNPTSVGINCNSPSYNLDVTGSFNLQSNDGVNGNYNFQIAASGIYNNIEFGGPRGSYIDMKAGPGSVDYDVRLYYFSTNTYFEIGGSARVSSFNFNPGNGTGRVGVLCNAPSYTFDVNGAARATDLYLNSTNSVSIKWGIPLGYLLDGSSGTAANYLDPLLMTYSSNAAAWRALTRVDSEDFIYLAPRTQVILFYDAGSGTSNVYSNASFSNWSLSATAAINQANSYTAVYI